MQRYQEVALKSRGLDENDYLICEVCLNSDANDIDHINGRKKSLLNDPTNLIIVCRNCHTNKGGRSTRQRWKEIVLSLIKPERGGTCTTSYAKVIRELLHEATLNQ